MSIPPVGKYSSDQSIGCCVSRLFYHSLTLAGTVLQSLTSSEDFGPWWAQNWLKRNPSASLGRTHMSCFPACGNLIICLSSCSGDLPDNANKIASMQASLEYLFMSVPTYSSAFTLLILLMNTLRLNCV